LLPESFLAELPVVGGSASSPVTFELSVADPIKTNARGLPFMKQRMFCGVLEFVEMPHELGVVHSDAWPSRGSVHEPVILPSWVRDFLAQSTSH
jgi:hypothetical protein